MPGKPCNYSASGVQALYPLRVSAHACIESVYLSFGIVVDSEVSNKRSLCKLYTLQACPAVPLFSGTDEERKDVQVGISREHTQQLC